MARPPDARPRIAGAEELRPPARGARGARILGMGQGRQGGDAPAVARCAGRDRAGMAHEPGGGAVALGAEGEALGGGEVEHPRIAPDLGHHGGDAGGREPLLRGDQGVAGMGHLRPDHAGGRRQPARDARLPPRGAVLDPEDAPGDGQARQDEAHPPPVAGIGGKDIRRGTARGLGRATGEIGDMRRHGPAWRRFDVPILFYIGTTENPLLGAPGRQVCWTRPPDHATSDLQETSIDPLTSYPDSGALDLGTLRHAVALPRTD